MSEKLITVAVLMNPVEAHIVRSMLAAEGITAIILNEQIAGVHLPLAILTGGIQVQVLESEAARAKELLAQEDASHGAANPAGGIPNLWDEDDDGR